MSSDNSPPSQYPPEAPIVSTSWQKVEPPTSSLSARVVLVAVCAAGGAVFAIPAAWVWSRVAGPPSAPLKSDGLVSYGEQSLDQLVGVAMWFIVVCLAFGIVSGLVVAWRGYSYGVASVVAVVALSAVASWLTYKLGHDVFGPDFDGQVKAAQIGDEITYDLTIQTKVAYLSWPIGGLIGAVAGVSAWPKPTQSASSTPMVE